jgi:NADPH-dependent curcumin reductase CurA
VGSAAPRRATRKRRAIDRYLPAETDYGPARRQIAEWIRAGRIKYREDIVEGIEKAPRAFIGLLRGENFGKLLVKLGAKPG